MEKICIREVNENLRRVELGQELTRPLKQLNTHCEFKKKYDEWCNIQEGLPEDTDIKKIEAKEKKRKYHQKPEVKERMREYRQRPEVKARMREHQRKYHQKPEVKERKREYQKENMEFFTGEIKKISEIMKKISK